MANLKKKAREKRKKRNRFKKFLERPRCRWFTPDRSREEVEQLLDYKNVELMQKMVSPQGKLYSRKRTQSCAKAQAMIKRSVKRARYMGLLPYVS